MSDAAHPDVIALVRSKVRVRFASLAAEQFAEYLTGRARAAGYPSNPRIYLEALSLDDLYLAQSCARGDEEAWRECTRAHLAFIRDFSRRFLRPADAAELSDRVVADLWEKRKFERYEGRSSLRTWLGAVVAHAAIHAGKVIRQREQDVSQPGGHEPAGPAPFDDRRDRESLARLAVEAIAGLSDEDKLLILLHYEQDLSLEQMAPIIGSSKATLSRRLKRIRESLRAAIEERAADRYGSSAEEMRRGADLGRLDLDLSALLRGIGLVKGRGGKSV